MTFSGGQTTVAKSVVRKFLAHMVSLGLSLQRWSSFLQARPCSKFLAAVMQRRSSTKEALIAAKGLLTAFSYDFKRYVLIQYLLSFSSHFLLLFPLHTHSLQFLCDFRSQGVLLAIQLHFPSKGCRSTSSIQYSSFSRLTDSSFLKKIYSLVQGFHQYIFQG